MVMLIGELGERFVLSGQNGNTNEGVGMRKHFHFFYTEMIRKY